MKKERNVYDSYTYRIGQNIARLRKLNGLTQSDMEEYGISRGYYGKIELGLYNITIDKLNLIAKAFGVNVSDIFKDVDGFEIK